MPLKDAENKPFKLEQVREMETEELNAELARLLYISPRTAAVHVSNILRKLEVGSRTEVAAALR